MPSNPRREARRKAGFRTQAKLAEKLGWHKSTVANIESGYRQPPKWYDWLIELAIKAKSSENDNR